MQVIIPRYEFRAFAQNFGLAEEKMRKLSKLEKFRESSEIYILSSSNSRNNVKIRYQTLDIKVLVQEEKGLQQWKPSIQADFPVKMEILRDEVLPALGATVPQFHRSEYTQDQLLEDIMRRHPDLVFARVIKRRFGYMINDCISEIAELLVNGAAIKTMAVESTDTDAILKTKEMLGLQEYENVNYVMALKRFVGLEPLPD